MSIRSELDAEGLHGLLVTAGAFGVEAVADACLRSAWSALKAGVFRTSRNTQTKVAQSRSRAVTQYHGGMRTLGVNCDRRRAYLAVAEDGAVADGYPAKLEPPSGLDQGERLLEFIDDVARALTQIGPDRVALLLPEASGPGASHSRLAPRVMIETLVRVGTARQSIPLELMSRPRLRSALGIPRSGGLDSHLRFAGTPTGPYWTTGRGLAALAALAAGAS